MAEQHSSSDFTELLAAGLPAGPPMIGALLRVPLEYAQQRMLERLHEHGFDDLDVAHLPVFSYPGPQGTRPSELAVRLRMSKQALNYLLGALERLGYLERQPHPDDQRSRRIQLTARGVATVPVIRGAVAEIEEEWAERLGRERFDALKGALLELNALAT